MQMVMAIMKNTIMTNGDNEKDDFDVFSWPCRQW